MAKLNLAARKESTKPTRKIVLIVCEGERTEPNYFKSFRLPTKVIEIKGVGMNTLSIVEHAVSLKEQYDYDEVWCVFDRDSFPKTRVSAAFRLITENKFKVAFSNESFELWYLLHYCYLDTKITRAQYCVKLSKYLGFDYEKNNPKIYEILLHKQSDAIRNAKRLEKIYPITTGNECDAAPTTSVYKLVERLNKLVKENEA